MFEKVLERFKLKRSDNDDAADRAVMAQINQQVAADARNFGIPGLSPRGALSTLDQSFIDARLDMPGKPDVALLKEVGGNRPFWDFLRSQRLSDVRAMAVLGGPGSGKTTLLQHLALSLANNRHERYGVAACLPVLIFASDYAKLLCTERAPTLDAFLQEVFFSAKRYPGLNVPAGYFTRQLEAGQCLILLDGIDEVGEAQQRQWMARWISKTIELFPKNRYILSSRPHGFRELKLDKVRVLEIQPLKGEQARRLMENWFFAAELGDNPSEDAVRQAATKRTNDVHAKLRTTPGLLQFLHTPLLTTTLARAYRRNNDNLSTGRITPYAELMESLLTCRARDAGQGIPAAQKLAILKPLATSMMKRRLRDLRSGDMQKAVAPLLTAANVPQAPEDFLKGLVTQGILLTEVEAGRFRFATTGCQEYLAAMYLAERPDAAKNWDQMVTEAWWQEALTLYAARADSTQLIQACLQSAAVPALALAADCLEVTTQIDPAVKEEADKVLRQALSSEDRKLRRQAAEVRLHRRLRSLLRMDEQREIDLDYVTCAEYLLFMEDMKERGHYYQPDHWPANAMPRNMAEQPVAGIRAEDARDFGLWLGLKMGGSVRFRPPQPSEAKTYPAPNGNLATVCYDGTMFNLVGLSKEVEQSIMMQLSKLPLLTLQPTLPMERPLKHSVDATFDHQLLEALDFHIDVLTERSIANTFNKVREMVTLRAIELGNVISPDNDLARSLAHATSNFHNIAVAIDKQDYTEAQRLIDELKRDSEEGDPSWRFATLMTSILVAVQATTPLTVQTAQRKYIAQAAEIIYQHVGTDDGLNPNERKQRQQGLLEFYAWLQIIMARAQGRLPAWEGIRLVREPGIPGQGGGLDLPTWAYNA